MKFTIDLGLVADWWLRQQEEVQFGLSMAASYVVVAIVTRFLLHRRWAFNGDKEAAIAFWLFSPFLVWFCLIAPFAYLAGWILSLGLLVPPPWRVLRPSYWR